MQTKWTTVACTISSLGKAQVAILVMFLVRIKNMTLCVCCNCLSMCVEAPFVPQKTLLRNRDTVTLMLFCSLCADLFICISNEGSYFKAPLYSEIGFAIFYFFFIATFPSLLSCIFVPTAGFQAWPPPCLSLQHPHPFLPHRLSPPLPPTRSCQPSPGRRRRRRWAEIASGSPATNATTHRLPTILPDPTSTSLTTTLSL